MNKETFKRRIRKITAFAAAVAMAVTVTMPGEIFGNIDFGITVFAEENGYVNGFCTDYADDNVCTTHTDCNGYQPATDSDSDGYLEIGNAGQLYWFAALVNGTDNLTQNLGANAILTDNIKINDNVLVNGELNSASASSFRKWTPIGYTSDANCAYTGTFDGKGKTISGLYYSEDTSEKTYAGLFGYNQGTISNMTIEDSLFYLSSTVKFSRFGAIVGRNEGTVKYCNNTGTINGTAKNIYSVGGICGLNANRITNCNNSGIVNSTDAVESIRTNIGGICGESFGKINDCNNTGKVNVVSDGNARVGGVCGDNWGDSSKYGIIDNCHNTADIISSCNNDKGYVGGVCGANDQTNIGNTATIQNCSNAGNITGSRNVGGVCGANQADIVGCHNSGTVEGTSNVGGVCGSQIGVTYELYNVYGKITNCYNTNTGTVKGTSEIGGICGFNYWAGTIENCYSAGSVSGTSNVGGVCGSNDTADELNPDISTIRNCYYDKSQYGGEAIVYNSNDVIVEKVEGKTLADFSEGEVCYLLNNGTTDGTQVWYQTINSDSYPLLDNSHGTVYASEPCPSKFSNTDNLAEEHNYTANAEYTVHTCTKCGETHNAELTTDDTADTISICHGFGTVTLEAPTENLTYDGTAKAATVEGELTGFDTPKILYKEKDSTDEAVETAPTNVGTYVASITYTDADSNKHSVSVEYTIEKAELTVSAGNYKVSKVYDGTKNPGTGSGAFEVTGLVTGDSVTITADSIGSYSSAEVGESNVDVEISLTDTSGNYTLGNTTVSVPAEITPMSITPVYLVVGTYTYTGSPIIPEVIVKQIGGGLNGGQAKVYEKDKDYTVTASNNINAGTATFTIKPVSGSNYTFDEINGDFTIGKAAPTDATTASQTITKGTASTAFAAPIFKGVDGKELTGSVSYTYGGQTYATTEALTAVLDSLAGGATGTISYNFTPTSTNYTTASGSISFSVIDAVITGITLKSAPTKTTYEVGEPIDLTGGQITVSYNNGTSVDIDITAEMISGFDSTTAGEKTVTVTYSGFTATFKVTVSKGSFTVEPTPGNIEGATIDMPKEELYDAVLTPEDQELIEQGVDIAVLMTVITINPETVPANDVTAIDNVMGDFELGCYIDVELFKRYSNGNPDVPVTDTNSPIKISFKVPADILAQYPVSEYEYSVFCSHNGVGYPITCSYNAATNVMSFSSTMFSTYALAVKSRTPAAVDYTITADSHVTVQATAQAGDIVSVTVEDGYKATVTNSLGTVITTITGTGSFVMPESNVTITSELINTHVHDYSTEWKTDSTSHWHECECGDRVNVAAHVSNGGIVTVRPTETTEGVRTYSCSICGYVMRTETIPTLDPDHSHSYGAEWKSDSTSHWHECDCGEKVDIASHISDNGVVTLQPTETSEGIMTYSCSICGYILRTETIPANTPVHTHNYGTAWYYDSTCHWHECSCGDRSNIGQHISNGGIVTVQPTATSTGLRVYSCSVCGYVLRTETIPATGFNGYPSYPTYPTYPTYVPPVITTPSVFTVAPEVEAEVNGSTVTLKWDEIKNVNKYYVYQYKDGKYVRVKTTTDTSVTFKNLKNGETYKFLVRYTINGKLSPTSYSGKITVKVYYKPLPKPTATKNSIKLTWEAVPEAEKYAIYKYVDGKAVKLTETKKLSVKIGKLIPDTEYKYIVRAYVDGKWTTMLKSDIVTVKTTAE